MKSLLAAVAAAALLTSGTGLALAQSSTGMKARPSSADMKAGSDMTGRHSMQGTVTSVDAKKGWIHVKTDAGTLIAYYPPAELSNVKKGDTVTLELAMKDNGPAAPKK